MTPNGCLWCAGWLYIHAVAVVGHRRAQGIVRRKKYWLAFYDDCLLLVVLSKFNHTLMTS